MKILLIISILNIIIGISNSMLNVLSKKKKYSFINQAFTEAITNDIIYDSPVLLNDYFKDNCMLDWIIDVNLLFSRTIVETLIWRSLNLASKECVFLLVCRAGNMEAFEYILKKYKEINPFKYDFLALTEAIGYGQHEIVKHLLEIPNKLNYIKEIEEGLKLSCSLGREDIVYTILTNINFKTDESKYFCLIEACRKGYFDIVRILIQIANLNISINDNEPFREAIKSGNPDIISLLLDTSSEVHPGANNDEAIQVATDNGYTSIVQILVNDERTNLAVNNNYPLKSAMRNGWDEIVSILLSDKYERVNGISEWNALNDGDLVVPFLPSSPERYLDYDIDESLN